MVFARGAQHPFQAEAVLGGLDLLAVLAADRGDEVGVNQCAFQQVDLAEEFQLADGEQVPGKHQQRQRLRREQALVADVVDGEDRRHGTEGGVVFVESMQQDRYQRRLPVMAVKYVGRPQDLAAFNHRPREQGEALGIIVVVAQRRSVESLAVEERRVIDKIELHIVA